MLVNGKIRRDLVSNLKVEETESVGVALHELVYSPHHLATFLGVD